MVEQRLSEKQDDGSAGPDVSDIQMCLKSCSVLVVFTCYWCVSVVLR